MSVKKIIVVFAMFFSSFVYLQCGADVLGNGESFETLPANFPIISTSVYGETAAGKVFITVSNNVENIGYYIMILNNDGTPYYYKEVPYSSSCDFKRLANGYYSYGQVIEGGFGVTQILNMEFEEAEAVSMGNGYRNDLHDFQLLPNGHYLLFCYDSIIADLTEYGGHPDAKLITPVLQELDSEQKVVWQWRFLDFFEPDDGPFRLDQSSNEIIHTNSIELDHDGHILVSNRRMKNCMKINRQTGEVMWILGGESNDFTFVGCDPEEAVGWFDGHDFRRLENGNVLFFDNSDQGSRLPSHVVEFRLDEENLVAELVWEYIYDSLLLGATRGGSQRLDNGNTMIGWGSASYYSANPVCTEVNAAGEKVFDLWWSTEERISSYRAFRFPVDYVPMADVVVADVVEGGGYDFIGDDTLDSGISIAIEGMVGEVDNELKITTYDWAPVKPTFAGHDRRVYKSRVVMSCESIETITGEISFDAGVFKISNPEDITIYQRAFEGAGEFSALITVYDPGENTVTADFVGGGEFIITYPDLEPVPFAPKAIVPDEGRMVNEDLPVKLQWSPRCFITEFDLQIATDSEFLNVVSDESELTSTIYEFSGVSAGTTYFWRVRAYNGGGVSGWSETASFTATAPYIVVTAPDGNDSWKRGMDYYIIWQDNLEEEVVIELYKGGGFVTTIDTVDSDGGYKWEVDIGLQAGCDYSVKIKSSTDGTVSAMSNPFRIDMQRGDIDCDGCVEFDDLNVLAGEWLQEWGGLTADLDDSGRVDFKDFAIYADIFMKSCP